MVTAKQMATVAAMSDADTTVIAYLEAAGGDTEQAPRWAVDDLLRTEDELTKARNAVSRGYVRALAPCKDNAKVCDGLRR